MQRFFVTSPLQIDMKIEDAQMVHQLMRVLRSKVGDDITLFDGSEREIVYTITAIDKKTVSLRGKEERFPLTEPKKQITLYQGMPNKFEKLEYIIEKWVEVGI